MRSVADAPTMTDYGQLLETHAMDAAGALECYRRAERLPSGCTDLGILAPLARLLHRQRGDLQGAWDTYRRAIVICADALVLENRAACAQGGVVPKLGRAAGMGGGDAASGCEGGQVSPRVGELRRLQKTLLVGYGDVLREMGSWRDAEDAYLTVMEQEPAAEAQARRRAGGCHAQSLAAPPPHSFLATCGTAETPSRSFAVEALNAFSAERKEL